MPFEPGQSGNPSGRPLGAIGEQKRLGREAIAKFVDRNADRLDGWLDAIAETNPQAAFNAYMSVVEYHIPKLQRQEITGKDGERLQINVVTGVNAVEGEFVEVGDERVPGASYAALPAPDDVDVFAYPVAEPVKRGRGRPRKTVE